MKFKKALAMVLAGAMALSLAACGGNRNSESTDDNKEKSDSGELSVSIRSLESKRFSQISQKRQELKQSLLW